MIVISDFTESKSDPRSGEVSSLDFGASKLSFNVESPQSWLPFGAMKPAARS